MKLSRFAIAAAVAALLAGKSASAQQFDGDSSNQPLQRVSYGRNIQPAEAPMAEEPPAAAFVPAGDGTEYKLHRGWFGRSFVIAEPGDEEEPGPWRLLGNGNFAQSNGIQMDGWIVGGYVWNPYRPADRFNGPATWMDRANEGNLQELWYNIHKDADNGGEGLALGYYMTGVYGTNSRFLTSQGLEDRINKTGPFYGVALPNLYGEIAYNDLKVKVGHFGSPVGFFAIGQPTNFFATLPYTYQYGEPFTHTGVLGNYQISDDLNIGTGFSFGWDNFDQGFNKSTSPIMMATRNNILKAGDSLAYFGIFSFEPNLDPALPSQRLGAAAPGFTPRYMQSLVYSRPITDNLSYVFQTDLGYQREPFGPGAARQNALWYGMNQYWFYKQTDRLTWGLNAEWFRDDGGFRVGGFLPNFGNNTNGGPTGIRGLSLARSGYDGTFYRLQAGPSFALNQNIITRSSLVWDWYSGPQGPNAVSPDGLPANLPFLNGSAASRTQVMIAQDLIIRF